jgi:hypothetical protein
MDTLATLLLSGVIGITGTVVGVALQHGLGRRQRDRERRIQRELEDLAVTELQYKRFADTIRINLVAPNPLVGYRSVPAIRDLMYTNGGGVDPAAIRELLTVFQEGVLKRQWTDTARHWLLNDTRRSRDLVKRLTAAEAMIATSLAERRRALLGEKVPADDPHPTSTTSTIRAVRRAAARVFRSPPAGIRSAPTGSPNRSRSTTTACGSDGSARA